MKTLISIIALCLACLTSYAQNRPDGSGSKPTDGIQIGGWDGTKFNYAKVAADGTLEVSGGAGGGGDATAANQTAGNASLTSIDSKIPASPSTAGNQTTGNTSLGSIDTKLTSQATAAKQDTAAGKLDTIITNTGAQPGNTSTTAATLAQGVTVVTTAGTPVQLVAASTLVESVEIHARKNTTTANTGNIYVGFASGAGNQKRVMQPGETYTIRAPAGKKLQLNGIYLDSATSADAVTYSSAN